MTKAEKRVAVAKDVLAQIKAKKLKAKSGVYVRAKLSFVPKGGEDVQTLLKQGQITSCSACALGSAFLSYARLYDNVKVERYGEFRPERDTFSYNDATGEYGLAASILADRPNVTLGPLFGRPQMELIEQAFEAKNSDWFPDGEAPEKALLAAEAFGKRYSRNEDRLVAIMRNIVRNKGTFKPSAR